ncbi:MAG: protein translocase subunit SecF [Bacillota bacterium]
MKKIDFFGMRKYWFGFSAAVILLGLIFLVMPGKGLRLGIDFTGGTILDLTFDEPVTVASVRSALEPLGLGKSVIQTSPDGRAVIIRTSTITEEMKRDVRKALEAELGSYQVERIEEVQGVISRELTRKAFLALGIAFLGMIVYITLRFEFKFAVTAIVALLHDVAITVGIFSIIGVEVESNFVAAILTIVGYSINDTIVVYDRIRENLKVRRKESLASLVNDSISQTLRRSINTSLTTLLAVGAIYVFGGKTTRDFGLALVIGILSGTYSSIFIASPLWVLWKTREEKLRKLAKA